MPETARRRQIEAVVHNIRRASFTVHARFREALTGRGLSMGQFFVLRTLVARGGGTPKDLARSMGVTTGNITGLVDKLEAGGLVARDRSKKDRRVVNLVATKHGHRLMEELRQAVVTDVSRSFESWKGEELERLNHLLGRIIEAGPCSC